MQSTHLLRKMIEICHRVVSKCIVCLIEQGDPLCVIVKQVCRVLVVPSDSVCRENETMQVGEYGVRKPQSLTFSAELLNEWSKIQLAGWHFFTSLLQSIVLGLTTMREEEQHLGSSYVLFQTV